MSVIELKHEIEINRNLEDAFLEQLRHQRAGMYERDDIDYMTAVIEDVESNSPQNWREETKQELALFLMYRAGFQCASGYQAEDFVEECK